MTTVYLAYGGSGRETLEKHAQADGEPVDLLVAVPFLAEFYRHRAAFKIRRWVLDSGAFTAFNSGKPMTYERWLDAARGCDADEIFGLDVIGDPAGSRANAERAIADGVKAIPTFHIGDPLDDLTWCCLISSKIALGGIAKVPEPKRLKWLGQCFARIWPHKVHGFACASNKSLEAFPFHSVDASSWLFAPGALGRWAGFTGTQINVRCRGTRDFRLEVVEHQKRAARARAKWRHNLESLETPETAV